MSTDTQEIPATTITVGGRLSFADIFVAREFKKGDGNFKFSSDILIPKKEEVVHGIKIGGPAVKKQIMEAIAAAKVEKWGGDTSVHPKIKASNVCFKDGDSEEHGSEETRGHWILRAKDDDKPTTLARNGRDEVKQSDGLIYSGSYANVMVNLWAMDNEWGKRINSNLRGVQVIGDGEKFGKGRVDAASMFGSLDDDDDTGFGDMDADDDDEIAF